MKLHLKNFRCYQDRTFDLSEDKLVLLEGHSGKGKTTIFEALAYVLYGSVKKPVSYGKSSCSVTLSLNDTEITRTSKPSKLSVFYHGVNYEKDEAQPIINQIFGMNETEFKAGSYVVQGSDASILTFTPTEQFNFIKNLVMADGFQDQVTEKVKGEINALKHEQLKLKAEIDVLETNLAESEISIFIEKPDLTEKEVVKNIERIQEQQRQFLENESRKKELEHLERDVASLEVVDSGDDVEELGIELTKYNVAYKEAEQYERYTLLKEEYESYRQTYIEEVDKKIEELKSTFITDDELTRLAELETMKDSDKVVDYQPYLDDPSLIITETKKLVPNIKNTRKLDSLLKKVEVYLDTLTPPEDTEEKHVIKVTCPSCEKCLVYTDGKLEIPPETEVDTTYFDVQRIRDILIHLLNPASVGTFDEEEYNVLHHKKTVTEANSEHYEKLLMIRDNNYTTDFLEKKHTRLEDMSKNLTIPEHPKEHYAELIREISTRMTMCNKNDLIKSTVTTKQARIKELQKEIKKYKVKPTDFEKEQQYYRQIHDSIREYEYQQRMREHNEKVESRLESCKASYSIGEKRLEKLLTIQSLSKKAELLSLEQTTQTINTFAQEYLNEMFTEPIIVTLETSKHDKNGIEKMQMNTYIEYKGHVYDSIHSLSGGERQRVNVAFLLAVNDLIGSKWLLFDECLSALDAETNTEVLSYLRDLRKGKNIFVISHEAVRGIFDEIIKI